MASLTIRNLDEDIKQRLKLIAARHGHSLEEEARQILRRAVLKERGASGLATRIARRFREVGGVDLPQPERSKPRNPPCVTEDN
ncbi:MAG: plasmid stabilization protein [Methylothermaceae bacteria B42]|nr:MAG: plasmid stabilization protein [Methylothermaceae bacteria B42]HHJ38126.1 plasmid stabilization protein [Methylothermaceae bacterium]